MGWLEARPRPLLAGCITLVAAMTAAGCQQATGKSKVIVFSEGAVRSACLREPSYQYTAPAEGLDPGTTVTEIVLQQPQRKDTDCDPRRGPGDLPPKALHAPEACDPCGILETVVELCHCRQEVIPQESCEKAQESYDTDCTARGPDA